MTTAAIILAAGRGTRAGGARAKQWQGLAGARVIDWTLRAFRAAPAIEVIALVLQPDEMGLVAPADGLITAAGGDTRADSVRAGLEALDGRGVDKVLVHDVARPCVTPALITAVIDALDDSAAAAPAVAVSDALWRGDAGHVAGIQPRDGLWRAQTPQGFDFAAIRNAHAAHAGDAADDVEVARAAGIEVAIVPGDADNLKITTAADFDRAARILRDRQRSGPSSDFDIRTGTGYDVHRFGPGDHVMLCGVAVPHDRGLQGHSDADVGMHAITDALYGALALGDIGRHFPPSEARWKGAESHIFLRHAMDEVRARGYRVTHIDCTLICERPKVGPHADAMRERLAAIAGLDAGRVSVKATTSERLGFTGRGEGIAAQAAATVMRP
ncbi:bifunctional 2-C-methyl-D-erythritol 4-phosphate cytidylyltransferase/2-C-methyl-D-erythritol 2,4-cyclodiphosphate synthase [Sediminimonas sp.]|uniref:bifunctional 2-C-methyl-D-erythritol 4-phosphate cytidylyltransferase/2-C-methyl-D-erythritol 2,4-cyclodiphosphate synthase n=1 Tax=Sediminimonas sp. TaxID=2823379 RepID=UPI0025E3FBFE|nr:bifunctional 2-C-methyl-D-erythritol 4-phosphate cytidylyltransferase/2-C-methyl-D-erythritol 2,4-cyclodiphosphate synthase [Sediminimonas sp.]